MKTIFKYALVPGPIELPEGAEVVHFDRDGDGIASIWCLVDTEKPVEKKTFVVKGTGHAIENNLWYLKSYKDTTSVEGVTFFWHLFEKLN